MSAEVWVVVPSVPQLQASSHGRIRAVAFTGKMPWGGTRTYAGKAWPGSWAGTRYITRFRGKGYKVARLVCEAFHGSPPEGMNYCLHLDEDARNNRPENLKWGTQKENPNAPGFKAYCRGRLGDRSPYVVGRQRAAADSLR